MHQCSCHSLLFEWWAEGHVYCWRRKTGISGCLCGSWILPNVIPHKKKTKQNMPLHLIITFEIYWIKFGWKEHLIEHRLHMCRVKIIKNGRFVQFSEGQVNQLYLQHRINMTKWLAQWHSSSPKWFLAVSKHWNLITAILPESITQQKINFTSSALKNFKNCSPNTLESVSTRQVSEQKLQRNQVRWKVQRPRLNCLWKL